MICPIAGYEGFYVYRQCIFLRFTEWPISYRGPPDATLGRDPGLLMRKPKYDKHTGDFTSLNDGYCRWNEIRLCALVIMDVDLLISNAAIVKCLLTFDWLNLSC